MSDVSCVEMPWGLKRFRESGQTYFVTFCCYRRRSLFMPDASKSIFEKVLERVRGSYRLCVYGYLVMPEHIYLLLGEPRHETLADSFRQFPLKPKEGLSGPPVDEYL